MLADCNDFVCVGFRFAYSYCVNNDLSSNPLYSILFPFREHHDHHYSRCLLGHTYYSTNFAYICLSLSVLTSRTINEVAISIKGYRKELENYTYSKPLISKYNRRHQYYQSTHKQTYFGRENVTSLLKLHLQLITASTVR